MIIMVDDERLRFEEGEEPETEVGPVPHARLLPAHRAVESTADDLPEIIQEMLLATRSEREGRLVIDYDQSGSMEEKKKEGYF